jgi:beta-lactamase regulating signal transducer with metallopeptidase domain/lipoprotein NlpI
MNSDPRLLLLLDLLLKSAVVLSLALLVARLWRGASAANRHLVWLAAFAVLLLAPLTALIPPRWSWQPAEALARETAPAASLAASAQVLADAPLPAPTPTPVTTAAVPAAPHTSDWPTWLAPRYTLPLVWLAGALALLSRLAAGAAQLWRWRRRSAPLADARALALGRQIAADLRLTRAVELRSLASCRVPMTWGVLRPVVLLPVEAADWPETRLALVLRHELGHIARHDWLARLLTQMAVALYWPNPLVWRAARAARLAQEQACDDLVLAAGVPAKDYALELVAAARRLHGPHPAGPAVAMAEPSTLGKRVEGIVASDLDRRPAAKMTVLIALAGGMLLLLLGSFMQLRASQPAGRADPAQGGQRIEPQDAAATRVVNTGAGSVHPLEAASFAVLADLKGRLAKARSDPNAAPRLIQELEVSIARQQQKIADDRKWVMSNWIHAFNGHRENAIHTTTADGQHIVIFKDGQQFIVPPGQQLVSVSNSQPVFYPDNQSRRDITIVNGQLIITTEGKQYTMPPDQVFSGWGAGNQPNFEPAPVPYTVPPGQAVTGFNRQNPNFAPIPDDATTYLNHGLAKSDRGDFDGAITDYDKAIGLNPNYAFAYANRGSAKSSKGDLDGAIADLDKALTLKPNWADAYFGRGAAKEAKGDYTGALADYDKIIALAKDDAENPAAYPRFYRILTLRRLHRDDGQAELARVVAKWSDDWWPKTVGLYLSGALPEKDLLAQIVQTSSDASEQQCEAYYYIGMTRLLAGDTAAAKEFFEKCLATKETTFVEFTFARAQLARMTAQK